MLTIEHICVIIYSDDSNFIINFKKVGGVYLEAFLETTVGKVVLIVVFIPIWISVWCLYHNIFDVYYFNLSKGCLTELMVTGFIATIISIIIIACGGWLRTHWYITVPVIIVIIAIVVKIKNRH